MKLCGLTGGVGMGKSTAASFFSALGARVIDTDEIARQLVQPGQPALLEIKNLFGADIFDAAGGLNRAALAKIVFASSTARKQLEAILHPRIRDRWLAQAETWRIQNIAIGIVVIPLLFETCAELHFEKVICTACSSRSQRERLAARGWDDIQIRQRLAAQMPVEKKIALSDFVLWTDGVPEMHRAQVEKIFDDL